MVNIHPAGEKCSDGGEYGVDIIFTPTGWSYQNTIDGFYCYLTGGRLSFGCDPCDECGEHTQCKERGYENPYPCEV
ncbi:hypothetical protein ACFL0A_01720 [Patescibacteria group bacterium]